MQVGRKNFAIALKKNPRRRFLCITEEAGDRRTRGIMAEAGLEDFLMVLIEMVKVGKDNPF